MVLSASISVDELEVAGAGLQHVPVDAQLLWAVVRRHPRLLQEDEVGVLLAGQLPQLLEVAAQPLDVVLQDAQGLRGALVRALAPRYS